MTKKLESISIETPLGNMVAIADHNGLHLLEFVDRKGIEREMAQFQARMGVPIGPGNLAVLQSISQELKLYFAGKLKMFQTPYHFGGTPFQKLVWGALENIPYGETKSYAQQAVDVGRPLACRAVANANSKNQLAILVPCQRIINSSGKLGGYAGGLTRKQWLLDHEKSYK
ncbi:MAG: methylated-DNA--[protein]-cysteine S-methyltransferase [Alphaproteobacteria bacterium]